LVYVGGENVTHLVEKPDRPPDIVFAVRLDSETARNLMKLAESRGELVTDTARDLLTDALSR
jgi:hypothetical protein